MQLKEQPTTATLPSAQTGQLKTLSTNAALLKEAITYYRQQPQADLGYAQQLEDYIDERLRHYQEQPAELTSAAYQTLIDLIAERQAQLKAHSQAQPKSISTPSQPSSAHLANP